MPNSFSLCANGAFTMPYYNVKWTPESRHTKFIRVRSTHTHTSVCMDAIIRNKIVKIKPKLNYLFTYVGIIIEH